MTRHHTTRAADEIRTRTERAARSIAERAVRRIDPRIVAETPGFVVHCHVIVGAEIIVSGYEPEQIEALPDDERAMLTEARAGVLATCGTPPPDGVLVIVTRERGLTVGMYARVPGLAITSSGGDA